MSAWQEIGKQAAALVGVAALSFAATAAGTFLLGTLLAGASYYYLRDHAWAGYAVAALCVLEALVIAVLLGGKRAVTTALTHGVERAGLGRAAVGLVFDRLAPVTAKVEHLPLAEAEQKLTHTVAELLHAQPTGGGPVGWVKRCVQAALLKLVGKLTLAHCRAAGGKIDLAKVRDELATRADGLLTKRLRFARNVWTGGVLLLFALLAAAQAFGVGYFTRSS